MIQLISLRFNYKRKSPSYPSPLDRGSALPNKLPLVSQESLNYSFYFSFIPLFPLSAPSTPPGLVSLSSLTQVCVFYIETGLNIKSSALLPGSSTFCCHSHTILSILKLLDISHIFLHAYLTENSVEMSVRSAFEFLH